MVTKKRVSKILVFTLLLTTLLSGFAFAADKVPAKEVKITGHAHIQDYGDTKDPFTSTDGYLEMGTTGEAKRVEEIGLKLDGAPADMDIVYMAHVQNEGDTEWKANGENAGSRGKHQRLEGIAIKLVKKGTDTLYPGYSVKYQVHMQDYGWGTDKDNNWKNGKADSWIADGVYAGTKGEHKRVEAVRLQILKDDELKVVDVSATNLKEVEVTFSTVVDKASAEKVANYSMDLYPLHSAKLQEDGKTVVLTLKEEDRFVSQEPVEIKISNIENLAKTKKITEFKTKFTPVDITIPAVLRIDSLGTKAVKVTFTEPVERVAASSIASYKIDGNAIAGSVKYTYPNTVIISTNMTIGEHKLSVYNVKDAQGYLVNAIEVPFIVLEDSYAPEIVSAKSIDLKKAEVLFDEPVKSIKRAYHTSTSNPATVSIADNKVTLGFANNMSISDTTIYFEDVEDYSGNKANRQVTIVPELDTTRPAVTDVKVGLSGSNHKFTVTFNKNVNETDAKTAKNYTLKKADGKVVVGKGFDADGHPVNTMSYSDKKVTFSTVGKLDTGTYVLEVNGIKDLAVVSNTMLPSSTPISIGDTEAPTISRAWTVEKAVGTKFDTYLYIQFSEPMAVEGNGNVLNVTKYNYCTDYSGAKTWKPMPASSTIELINNDTVKINLPRDSKYNINGIRVTLVSDLAGNFLGGSSLQGDKNVYTSESAMYISIDSANSTAKDTVEVVFDGKLVIVDSNDFAVYSGTVKKADVTLDSFNTTDAGKTKAIFKLSKNMTADAKIDDEALTFKVVSGKAQDTIGSQDAFGIKVNSTSSKLISDSIKPAVTNNDFEFVYAGTGVYKVKVEFDDPLTVNLNNATNLVTVKVDDKDVEIANSGLSEEGKKLVITLATNAYNKLNGKDSSDIVLAPTSIITVSLDSANDTVKAIVDGSTNAAKAFTKNAVLSKVLDDAAGIAVATDKESLTLSVTNATEDSPTITLPTTGANETTITWATDNDTYAPIIDTNTVTVIRDETEQKIAILTATIEKDGAQDIKTFTVTIPTGTGAVTVE